MTGEGAPNSVITKIEVCRTMPPKRKAGGGTSSPSTTPTVSSATLVIAANGTGIGCEVAVVGSSGVAQARRGSVPVEAALGGSSGGVGAHDTGSESAASSSRRSAVYSAVFGDEEEEEDENDSDNQNNSVSDDESSSISSSPGSLTGRVNRVNGGTGISFSFNATTTTNPTSAAETTTIKPSISLKRNDGDEDDEASSVLSATSSLSNCTNSSHNSYSQQQQPSSVRQTLLQPERRQRTLSASIYNRQSLGGAGMFAQQDNQEDDNDEVDNIGDQEDGIGEEEEEEEEGEEEEEADENELEEQANSKGTDQEHQEDDGTAGENASQLFHPSSASTATSILTVEGSAVLVQNSGISTVASATAADGQESSKENHQADASSDLPPLNTPLDFKSIDGSPKEPKHLEREVDEQERIRRLAYKALQEIEADLAKFKNRFYLEESFKIDMEIKTVRDGTHARIASETVAIESRKHAFDTFSSERLRMLLVRYEGECAAAVEIANVEFVRKKAETRSHLMEEAVRNCSLLTEEMRRYHMPHRDRGVSHKRRKTRRHDFAEWKSIMEDDLLDDALPTGPVPSFSPHSASATGHRNHQNQYYLAHAQQASQASTVKRKPQMTAASVYGYFPSAHVNGLSAQRVDEDLSFLGIK